jgi:hypothetical protein
MGVRGWVLGFRGVTACALRGVLVEIPLSPIPYPLSPIPYPLIPTYPLL